MQPRHHRSLTWAITGLAAALFLAILFAYANGAPLSRSRVVAPGYVLLAGGLLALAALRPRSGSPLPVGADRWRWRVVLACAAVTASGFLFLVVFPPASLLPWAAGGGVAMIVILVVAIVAILFPPKPTEAPAVRPAPAARAPSPPARSWSVIYATSRGVAIADGANAPPLMDDYFVTQGGQRIPLSEVERIIDKTLAPSTQRPTDAELLAALRRWGEIVEAPP